MKLVVGICARGLSFIAATMLIGFICSGMTIKPISMSVQDSKNTTGSTPQLPQRKWHLPTYLGLVIGKSTKEDVKRRFGKPIWEGPPEEKLIETDSEGELLYEYVNVGDIKGQTTIVLGARTGIVKAIEIYPQQVITLQEVFKRYGNNYIERPSNLGPCPTNEVVRNFKPLKEREYPFFLVYPEEGMYISIQRDSTVLEIGYVMRCP
jgi:hypothetical protein